ncbi:hypothetical protein L208DRAFT_10511 [Tricholoma matsutake]|nr:hypothetical protein L208DRAFT_10511 [Tricholoma matsutake 945]
MHWKRESTCLGAFINGCRVTCCIWYRNQSAEYWRRLWCLLARHGMLSCSDSLRTLYTCVTIYWLCSHMTTWSRCAHTHYSICPPPKKVTSPSPQKENKRKS